MLAVSARLDSCFGFNRSKSMPLPSLPEYSKARVAPTNGINPPIPIFPSVFTVSASKGLMPDWAFVVEYPNSEENVGS